MKKLKKEQALANPEGAEKKQAVGSDKKAKPAPKPVDKKPEEAKSPVNMLLQPKGKKKKQTEEEYALRPVREPMVSQQRL